MKRSVLLCLVFFSSILITDAKQSGSLPATGATPVPQPTPLFPRSGRGSQMSSLQATATNAPEAGPMPDGLALQQLIVQTYAQSIYRKPTEKELMAIAPQSGIGNRYHDFLAKENTGIFRLVADHNCSENTKVISVSDDCLKYTMPGSGNSYSFRVGTYRVRDLADLTYADNRLLISGMMMQGILVGLGDVPVEDVSLQSKGLKYLTDFQPVTDFENARAVDGKIVTGVEQDGFYYRRSLPAKENETYALRAIAYRGKLFRSVRGIPYNEFDFDKRRDVIVAFRIVFRDADDSLTIVWKQLSSADAPKLRPPVVNSARTLPPNVAEQKLPN